MIKPRKTAIYYHINNETDEIIYIGVAAEMKHQTDEHRRYPRAFDMSANGRKDCLL